MRGLLGEFVVVLQAGLTRFSRGISAILEDAENGIPMPAQHLFADLYDRFQQLDAKLFKNGPQFVAWLGLVPRQHSSGGKTRLGHINKRGDAYYGRC